MYKVEGPEDGGVAPKGPNFLLIVILFAVAIFVILGLGYLLIPGIANRIRPVNPDSHPTSQRIVVGRTSLA